MRYVLSQLKQPSTWRGLLLLASAAGMVLRPDLQEHFIALGMALAGLVGAAVPDRIGPSSGQ